MVLGVTLSVPPLTVTVPLLEFAALLSTKMPAPVLVSALPPLTTPLTVNCVPVTLKVPPPVPKATVRFVPRLSVPPVNVSVPPAMEIVLVALASPRLLLAPMLTVPPLMATLPLNPAFVPLSTSVPVLVFVRAVVPLIVPSTVRLLAPVTSKVPPPAPRATVRFVPRTTAAPVLCRVPPAIEIVFVALALPRLLLALMLKMPPLMLVSWL